MYYSNDPDVIALIQKKKNDAIKAIEDEKFIREILKDRFWLDVLHSYNQFGHCWHPNICPVDKMVESYNIINQFKSSIENDVNNAVKEYLDEWWGEKLDIALNTKLVNQGNGWFEPISLAPFWNGHSEPSNIINKLMKNDEIDLWIPVHDGAFSSPPRAPTNWKAIVVRHMADPLIQSEYDKLQAFYSKCKERSKRESQQPSPQDAKAQIQSLEEQIKTLKERNSVLEEKFANLKALINIQ